MSLAPWAFGALALAAAVAIAGSASASVFPTTSGLSAIRDAIIREALKAVGLSASGDPTAFEEFLGGSDEAAGMKHDMALAPASSTCGLVMRAILRAAGFKDPRLFAPYRIGMAISDLIAMAKEVGAWIEPAAGVAPPRAGDLLFLDVDKPTGHVATITAFDPVALTLETVDGGAVDAQGHQSVAKRTRRWNQIGAIIIDTPNMGNQHRVTGWIDVDKLAAGQGLAA